MANSYTATGFDRKTQANAHVTYEAADDDAAWETDLPDNLVTFHLWRNDEDRSVLLDMTEEEFGAALRDVIGGMMKAVRDGR